MRDDKVLCEVRSTFLLSRGRITITYSIKDVITCKLQCIPELELHVCHKEIFCH